MITYRVNKDYKKIQIFDSNFLFAGRAARKTNKVLTPLNETADLIWTGIYNGDSIKDIIAAISKEYDVEPEIASEDMKQFCEEMELKGYLLKSVVEETDKDG